MSAVILADNILMGATVTPSSTAANAHERYLTDWRTYTRWEAATTAQQTLTIDCTVPVWADMLGIARHNLAGVTVQLETSADGLAWTPRASFALAADPDVYRFTAVQSRFWRLIIPALAGDAARIAILAIGQAFDFEQPVIGEYTPIEEQPRIEAAQSEAGALLGLVTTHTDLSARVDFEYCTDAWFRNTFMPLWDSHLSKGLPFFWSPELDVVGLTPYKLLMRIKPNFEIRPAYQAGARRKFSLDLVGTK